MVKKRPAAKKPAKKNPAGKKKSRPAARSARPVVRSAVVNRSALLSALALMPAPRKTSRPILSCVHLHTHGSLLYVEGTDMEVAARVVVKASGALDVVVSCARLISVLQTNPDDDVTLAEDDGGLRITASGVDAKLLGEKPDDFPAFTSPPETAVFVEAPLASLLRKVSYAAATNNTPYALNGIEFEFRKNTLHITATDGKRLASVSCPCEASDSISIVPANAVSLLRKATAFAVTDNIIFARGEDFSMSSRLIDGRFPDWRAAVPKGGENVLTIRADEFKILVQRASIFTDGETALRLAFSGSHLQMSSQSIDAGKIDVDVEVQYTGSDMEIGFIPTNFLDLLSVAGEDPLTFTFKDSSSAVIIKDGGCLCVVMPVTIGR